MVYSMSVTLHVHVKAEIHFIVTTLKNYPCTVSLLGNVNWSAFLVGICWPCKVTNVRMVPIDATNWVKLLLGLLVCIGNLSCKNFIETLLYTLVLLN